MKNYGLLIQKFFFKDAKITEIVILETANIKNKITKLKTYALYMHKRRFGIL